MKKLIVCSLIFILSSCGVSERSNSQTSEVDIIAQIYDVVEVPDVEPIEVDPTQTSVPNRVIPYTPTPRPIYIFSHSAGEVLVRPWMLSDLEFDVDVFTIVPSDPFMNSLETYYIFYQVMNGGTIVMMISEYPSSEVSQSVFEEIQSFYGPENEAYKMASTFFSGSPYINLIENTGLISAFTTHEVLTVMVFLPEEQTDDYAESFSILNLMAEHEQELLILAGY